MEEEKKPALAKLAAREAKVETTKPSVIEAKIASVEASRLPEADKEKLLRKLKSSSAKAEDKMRFGAYANMKGIQPKMRAAMQAYPKARDVVSATVEQWDEIFKSF